MVEFHQHSVSEWDLHCHSMYSDGTLSPAELASRAKARGVTTLALTDHDTLEGIPELREAANEYGLSVLTGVECSTQWSGYTVHIVGLNFSLDSDSICQMVDFISSGRFVRSQEIARRLERRLGLESVLDKATRIAGKGVVGRPHFAQVLVAESVVNTNEQAFRRFLGAGKLGDVKQQWPSVDEVVSAIVQAGGVAVLAHPGTYKMTRTKLRRLIEVFAEAGGQAVELSTPAHSADFSQWLQAYLNEKGLAASVGSDFHSPNGWVDLGGVRPLDPSSCQPVWSLF